MRNMVSLCSLVLFLFVSLAASEARAARACEYDLQCADGRVCVDGACQARPPARRDDRTALEACGDDRRCRIDRLRRKNDARRHVATIEEERWVREMIEQQEEKRLEDFPRLADPWAIDLRVSRMGALGLMFGRTFRGHFRAEGTVAFQNVYVSHFEFENAAANISGDQRTWWFGGHLTYLVLESWFTPYLTAGFLHGAGQFDSYANDGGFFGTTSAVDTEYHAAEVGGGVDAQFSFGLHARFGLAYRPLIYNQARTSPGSYDQPTRDGLAAWFARDVRVDPIFLLGWAF